jgi:hypothetical protein
MNPKPGLERLIYCVVIIVCLLALALVVISSVHFVSVKPVYQGF